MTLPASFSFSLSLTTPWRYSSLRLPASFPFPPFLPPKTPPPPGHGVLEAQWLVLGAVSHHRPHPGQSQLLPLMLATSHGMSTILHCTWFILLSCLSFLPASLLRNWSWGWLCYFPLPQLNEHGTHVEWIILNGMGQINPAQSDYCQPKCYKVLCQSSKVE